MPFFQIRKKVHWSDTDAAGVAWFPNFLGWFEDAEEEMFASLGRRTGADAAIASGCRASR
jgi:acyl-CoA thioesterase FadM